MARKTKEDSEQTRRAILDSAMQVLYEKGYSRTTFDEIAARINLTKGAVYWHFKSKTDLITALVIQKISEQHNRYKIPEPKSLSELCQTIFNRAKEIEKDENFRKFLFFVIYRMEWSEAIFAQVWSEIRSLVELPLQQLFQILLLCRQNGEIKKDVDLNNLRDTIAYFWRGALSTYLSKRKPEMKFSEDIKKGIKTIFNGIQMEKK